MSIRLKTEQGYVYVAMAIRCNESTIKTADNGCEYIRCLAKTVKPQCGYCSLANPNRRSADPTNSHQPGF